MSNQGIVEWANYAITAANEAKSLYELLLPNDAGFLLMANCDALRAAERAAALEAENERLRVDAERYRALRVDAELADEEGTVGAAMDAHADALRAAKPAEGSKP